MNKAFLMVGVLLCTSSWQANATDVGADSSPGAPTVDSSAQGGVPATASMSGGPSASLGKTRAQVNQELLDSQRWRGRPYARPLQRRQLIRQCGLPWAVERNVAWIASLITAERENAPLCRALAPHQGWAPGAPT